MKHIKLVLMITALVVLTTACSNIKTTRTADGVGVSKVTVAKATVVDVDYENRMLVLKDNNGKQLINLGPDAQDFGKIKVGDTVMAEVIESVRVVVEESADEPFAAGFETAQRDSLKPGAQKVTVVESTARVEKIDYDTRMITLSGTNGRRITIEAGPEIKRFNEIKQGDMISMQIVKQTIIRVESR